MLNDFVTAWTLAFLWDKSHVLDNYVEWGADFGAPVGFATIQLFRLLQMTY